VDYKQQHKNCPVDNDWTNPEKRELFIQKVSDLAFGLDTIERGYHMDEVLKRLEDITEFAWKHETPDWEELIIDSKDS
tara:strand:- start:67 stop:300 length:234 start_codon:yes stop_codon:yes gene_type:complete